MTQENTLVCSHSSCQVLGFGNEMVHSSPIFAVA